MGNELSTNRIEYIKKWSSTSPTSVASSISSSPLDLDVQHLETFILVYLNPQTNEDQQNEALQKRLRQHVPHLLTFNDYRSCEQWLKAHPTDEKILLIVPAGLA